MPLHEGARKGERILKLPLGMDIDEAPADEAKAPIDLVSNSSESTGCASDSDDSSVVVVVEPIDQAAEVHFTQHMLNDVHAPMVTVILKEQALAPAYWLRRLTLSTYSTSCSKGVSQPKSRLPVLRPSHVPMLTLPPT